ncbi:unnamed protein product, partial [marine sediment metagenome]
YEREVKNEKVNEICGMEYLLGATSFFQLFCLQGFSG